MGDGQYGVVEVGNVVVVQLGNSKVAASWLQIFFDEHVAWICGLWISALSNFLHRISFSIGSWHVGSSGGHRRAVTSGHRKGPGSN